MTMTKLKAGIVGAIAVATVTTPLVIYHQGKLRESDRLLQQQKEQLALLIVENQRHASAAAAARTPLADDQFKELLRLRGEIGLLRKQTNELSTLQAENSRLRASFGKLNQNSQEAENDPAAERRESDGHCPNERCKRLMLEFWLCQRQPRPVSDELDQLTAI